MTAFIAVLYVLGLLAFLLSVDTSYRPRINWMGIGLFAFGLAVTVLYFRANYGS